MARAAVFQLAHVAVVFLMSFKPVEMTRGFGAAAKTQKETSTLEVSRCLLIIGIDAYTLTAVSVTCLKPYSDNYAEHFKKKLTPQPSTSSHF